MAGSILFTVTFAVGAASTPAPSLRGSSTDPQRSCAFWDGLDIKGSVCPQQWQGQYAGTASCKSCWEGEDCGWTCDLTDGTKAGVDLQAYVHASHGEGYCARNPSNDPCLGWQVFGDGCTDCAANGMSSSAQASASLQSTDPQRSCAFWDGLDIKGSVCPQQWQGQYAGTASCKSCWEGEDCGWTCDLTDGTKAGVDLQAYVHASPGEGYCARNPSNDPCLGWQVFGDGCTDCAASGMSSSAQASASLQSTDAQRSCAFWDGLDIKGSVCPQQWQGQYARTASCKSCWEGEDCGWTCDLTDGTKAGVDLQAYVHASHGEGYCARNPSNDPCLGWQVFGDGCTDCAASDMSSSAQASASLQSTDAQRSCAFLDGLDIKGSVCPQQWQGQYAGTASCKSCWEGEDCGWTCDLTDGTKAGVDLQAYVHASPGEGYCARNPSNDPCLGWQVFGDGCTDCAASGMSSSAQASASLQSTDAQRSCAFWDGLDIKGSVCPQQWQGQYAGTASCKSCWEGEDCGWTCDLTDGTKASVDLQAYVHASHGEGYCARNPSNDPCLGWQVFGDGCTDC